MERILIGFVRIVMKRTLIVKLSVFIVTVLAMTNGNFRIASANLQRMSGAEIANELALYLEKLTVEDKFSGAVLVAKDGKPIFVWAYGMANKGGNIPNRVDTKFNLGSMNKMFTAVAIAQLVECGKLSFSDTAGKHLPNYPNKAVAEKVTIHHLLTHTSGLGDYLNERFYAQLERWKTVESLLPLFVNDPLTFEPGEGWEYSNAGFAVLGLVVEKVSGQSYFDYVRKNIFKPADMTNTHFYERDKNVPNRAVGYMRVNAKGDPGPDAPRRENTSTRPAKGSPAGGAYSTVNDTLKFHLALRNHKLLSREYTDIVTTGKVKVPAGQPMNEYGYGFTISTPDGKRIVGHGGAGAGVAGKFEMYPELGYIVVILTNYELPAMMPVIMKTRGLILKQ
jgi:D-alanyl-D-alanine carboxypeptidase